jgi:arylsulfatase A-like enzyme
MISFKTFTWPRAGRSWLVLGALAIAAFLLTLLAPIDRTLAARPNFVIIQTDDQNAETVRAKLRGAVGGFQPVMPHAMKQIVGKGTEFRNYYAATPVCSPSRASLLSGQYPWNNGVEGNVGPSGGWTGWQNHAIFRHNLATTLHDNGYYTAHIGKFTNGYYDGANSRIETTVPPGWDSWITTSYVRGTHFYGYNLNVDGHATGTIGNPLYKQDGPGIDPPSCALRQPEDFWPNGDCLYSSDVFTMAAVRQIRRSGSVPFFIQLDYQAPHGDVAGPRGPQPATRNLRIASDTPLPRSGSFNEADFSDKPALIRAYAPRQMGPNQIERTRNTYRRYVESLRSVDDGIGAILRTLRATSKLRDTYVFLLSDHGLFLGDHRFDWGKFLPYEDAASPFMAVRGPGVARGAVSREVTGNIDVAATIMRLAKARPDYEVDGRSLKPFWRDPNKRTSRPFAITINSGQVNESSASSSAADQGASASAHAPPLRYRGFRVGPYKYIRYARGGEELYNLLFDPNELNNRINAPAYAAVRAYMRANLNKVTKCEGSACRKNLPAVPTPG